MEKNLLIKFKKYGLYVLAVIGALAILLVLWKIFLQGPIVPYRYDRAISVAPAPGGFLARQSEGVGGIEPGFFDEEVFGVSEIDLREGPAPRSLGEVGELTERKVIKNGTLDMLVESAEETADEIKEIAKRSLGFVENVNIFEVSKDVKEGFVTIRVPADRFDEVMEEIKALAIKVEREQINARDVTEQFVDFEARLKNLRAEEEQYLKIIKKAETVEDMLAVERELSRVRGQIERIEGQLKFLSRQIDMSTITAHLTALAEVEVFGVQWRPLIVAKQALKGLFEGLTKFVDAIIIFLIKLPIIILWIATIALLVFIVWRIGRWLWNITQNKHKT